MEGENDIPFAPAAPLTPEQLEHLASIKCMTCSDHGFIGGLVRWGDGEVDSVCDPCPDCNLEENENEEPVVSENSGENNR